MTPTLILPVWIRPTICWDLPIASSAIMSARWRTINKPPNLHPRHRGALAYLGETYLAKGRETHTIKTLNRLVTACKRVMETDPDRWQSDCKASRDLKTATEAQI